MKTFLGCLVLLGLLSSGLASEVNHRSRGEVIAEWLAERGVPEEGAILAISTLPIVELRGAIPAGHIIKDVRSTPNPEKWKPSLKIFLLAVLGNMIPVPFILLLLGPCSQILMKCKWGAALMDGLFARTRKKTANVEQYEALGLTLFVAIPLPVTGAWTGAMAAFLMGTPFWQSMICILLGVMIAGVIMTLLSLLGWIGAAIAGVVLTSLVVLPMIRYFNKKKAEVR
jgi:uncharacterized membrane protein